jgi:hypothetical protein
VEDLTVTHEYKTLKELDVKPGDFVEYDKGVIGIIDDNLEWLGEDGKRQKVEYSTVRAWRIISRASDTPKLWRDMTPEEKGALLLAHHEGEEIEWSYFLPWKTANDTAKGGTPTWDDEHAYRVRPEPEPTPMVVPWEALADWAQWVARREDGFIFGYELEPHEYENDWVTVGGRAVSLVAVKIDPGTCDWRDSLQKRPEGV